MSERKPANRKTFTEDNVHALKVDRRRQYLVWDAGTGAARGLAILVSPQGAKSYRCAYYYPGSPKPHYKHLGRVGEMTLEEARDLTFKVRRDARAGIDPRADDPHKSDSFQATLEAWIAHEQIGSRGNKSALGTKAVMLHHCREWLERPVATIRSRDIENLLWRVRDGDADRLKPHPHMANRLHIHLKHFFDWCGRPGGGIKSSPMTGMKRPANARERRERDWFQKEPGDQAIQCLWKVASDIGGDEGKFIKLAILTGKRKGALDAMRWEHIQPDWFWNAPKSEIKNKRLHAVPLAKLAQRVLHPRRDQGPVFDNLNLVKLQAKVRALSGMADFFFHGLRHLAETKTAELRDNQERAVIPPYVRDLLFDHVPKRGSGKAYDHHDYKAEMRAAVEAWADYVGGKVAPQGTALLG
jgi:integrase